MRKLLITICLLALFLEISGLVFSTATEEPNEASDFLSKIPERVIQNPKANGYFLLLGFAADESSDPVQVGLDMWLEADLDRGRRFFNYEKPIRSSLRLEPGVLASLDRLTGDRLIIRLRARTAHLQRVLPADRVFVSRYKQWLAMPFEDWGYGHLGHPRYAEIFAARRLYLGEGFARSRKAGLWRLQRDLTAWRTVMARSTTLSMKTLAAVNVTEDSAILSEILTGKRVDPSTLSRIGRMTRPLTPKERSLLWPVRNEFTVGAHRPLEMVIPDAKPGAEDGNGRLDSSTQAQWLAGLAGLRVDAFEKVERPLSSSVLGFTVKNQRTLNTYAVYYEAILKAAETTPSPLPRLREVAGNSPRTLVDTFLHPIHEEPAWDLFTERMFETDARLRLAALQVVLRLPDQRAAIPVRIAGAGAGYYDPFTGLPMMWNGTSGRLYSVGRDGLDDGGEPTFDIAVSAVVMNRNAT